MPSFAIEVPGEANPLTEGILVNTLQSAASSNPNQIQTGTKQLSRWEKEAGFYRHLQSAYLSQNLPIEIRYLAIIQLKNGIDKYWRKTAANAVSKDDKEVIRSRLAESVLTQHDNRLALQAALVVAKIARYEYPNDWPDAISTFVSVLRRPETTPAQVARTLLALLHIVKDLSTGRLQRTRQYMQAATPEIVSVVGNVYAQLISSWRSSMDQDSMQQSLLAIKLLRRLLVSGYEHPSRDADVTAFWNLSLEHLAAFLPLVSTGDAQIPHNALFLIGRHTVQLAKLHHEMAKDHPAAFALLPNSLQLTQHYWSLVKDFGDVFGSKEAVASALSSKIGTDGDSTNEKPFTEKIALKGLLIIRACAKMVHNPAQTFKYRTAEDKEERNRATEVIKQTLFTEQFVREVMETLVTKFFVFRESDLREWLEEPEEWEKREEGEGEDWEFSVRSCSEKLFLDLAINYKEIIVGPLLNVFYSVANADNDNVLFKDSVYTAIGLSASVIHPQLDFDAFIQDVLVQDVQKLSPGYNILRRRAAILLGQWITVKVSEASRPLVYQIFQHLLNHEDSLNDQVVRVTAGRQFANIANDWDFKPEAFMPYAQTILTQLMTLIGEVELTETKMALLNTISVIVERLDVHITPYADRIVTLLPPLWEQSGEEHLMKQAILTILARLVNAMKAESLPLHSMVVPIIRGAVEPGSETQVYLLEDALDLWHAVLTQTPDGAVSPELFDLVQYLVPIYELGSENLRKALEIAESYVLAAPQLMLADPVRSEMFRALATLLGGLKPDANGCVCNVIETSLRLVQRQEIASSLPLGQFTNASYLITYTMAFATDPENGNFGFFPKLLQGLHGSWTAHCTTGPNAQQAPVDGIVETDYFAIIARAILGSLEGFIPTLQAVAASSLGQQDISITLKWLIEEWTSHFENIGDPSRKKLMCLALTKLLETKLPVVLESLQSLMTIWTSMLLELREDEADTGSDTLQWKDNTVNEEYGPETPEDVRRRALTVGDEVHTINLPQFIQHHLQQAIAVCGGQEQFQEQWLVNVDKDVVKSFGELGIM
ncbi:Putative importin-beta domain, armadillo-like helical, exportin-1/Importin-beta [Septoria linicola]|uniref:Importin-beta domain, armadillo-like helical, exportin-1/Importin-beta n=1 Tax=Septoria linicola TaxID=215465 RepID=A0A9Q9AH00_9PEZI|nr:Putative importin-beta domain, armadillo-like helical, exportin-1/Importin-beta [Septoria linicola]